MRKLLRKIIGVLKMATYSVIQAVAGTKNKASVYNENFTRMKNYVDTSISDLQTETQSTLSVYQNVNSLLSSGTLSLSADRIYVLTPSDNVTFTLPTIEGTETSKFHQIMVQVAMPETVYTINLGTTHYFDLEAPDLTHTGNYNIYFEYDNINNTWVAGAVRKG